MILSMVFYYVCFAIASGLVLARVRRFDGISIYFFALTIFFTPLFFFSIYDPVSSSFRRADDLVLLIGGVAYLGLAVVSLMRQPEHGPSRHMSPGIVSRVFLLICAAVCLVLLYRASVVFLSARSKRELLDDVDFGYMILTALVPVAFCVAYLCKRRIWLAFYLGVAIILFLFGSRRALTFVFLVWVYFLCSLDRQLLIRKVWLGALGLAALAIVVAGKSFYSYFLIHGVDGIGLWYENLDMNLLFSGMEFMATSAILQYVVEAGFSIDPWVVPAGILSALPLPLSVFGISSSWFNELFQPALFPGVRYEMAYNPWAEAYSWMRLPGVVAYAIAIPLAIRSLEKAAIATTSEVLSGILIVLIVAVSFWVHRNSIGSELAYLRNIFYPAVILLFASKCVVVFIPNRKVE